MNAHSHAFHRAMRGDSQIGCVDGDSFWRWRDNMYRLVDTINTTDRFYTICKQTFDEMIRAGITTVGEFHYLHHLNNDDRAFDLDAIVLKAANDSGIRLVLIETLYRQSNVDDVSIASLAPTQRRFVSKSVEQFCDQLDRIQPMLADRRQTLAVAGRLLENE